MYRGACRIVGVFSEQGRKESQRKAFLPECSALVCGKPYPRKPGGWPIFNG
jgi:hypothetical protein